MLLLGIILWSYAISLNWMTARKFQIDRSTEEKGPTHVAILVPYFNEEEFLESKAMNLSQIDLSGLVAEITFIDGGSTDRSALILEPWLNKNSHWKILRSPSPGKIQQLNYALTNLSPEIEVVINTDVDAEFSSDAVKKLLSSLRDSSVGVAGGKVIQVDSIELDVSFWKDQNEIRLLESDYWSCTSVVAPLYAFRRKLVGLFPDDCIADDLYVTFEVNRQGFRSLYRRDVEVKEKRGVHGIGQYLRHKYRKGFANLRETFRFLNGLGEEKRWKFLFLNRLFLVLIMPFVFFLFLLLSISYVFRGTTISFSLIVFGILLSVRCMARSPVKLGGNLVHSIANLFIANAVLLIAIASYPFKKFDSRYERSR